MPTPNEIEDRELWSEKAPHWDLHMGDEGDRNRRRHINPVLWRMLGDVEGKTIVDAGCGPGWLSAKLAQRGAHVSPVDYAPGMVAHAQARFDRLGLDLHAAIDDCCHLDTIEDQSQDALVSVYVLQDLERFREAAETFHRVLKPGGIAVLVFGHPCFGVPGGPERDEDTVTYTWPFSYFEERRCEEVWRGRHHETEEPIEFPSRFTFYHRPLAAYWRAFADAGFRVLDFDEPVLKPPYPEDMPPEEVRRTTRCAWSVAFHLEATAANGR